MTISTTLRDEAWSNESDLPLVLLTISHSSLTDDIRVVNNRVNVTSNGNDFTAFPFEITLPDSRQDAPPTANLKIDNVSREIGQAIRLMDSPADITIQVVRQDDPDTIEIAFAGMKTGNIQYDALTVSCDLVFENLVREPFPAVSFSPAEFPGLLR